MPTPQFLFIASKGKFVNLRYLTEAQWTEDGPAIQLRFSQESHVEPITCSGKEAQEAKQVLARLGETIHNPS